jgi:hypothetical protein
VCLRGRHGWSAAANVVLLVCDLESASVEDVARHLESADASVFAAGAGPGSGIARKDSVDRAAAGVADRDTRWTMDDRYLAHGA